MRRQGKISSCKSQLQMQIDDRSRAEGPAAAAEAARGGGDVSETLGHRKTSQLQE
jgi:hypothetical protein